MGKVLVTDGGERSTLAVVRSLGRSGIEVIVASDRLPALASVSKYCAGSVHVPSALARPEEFVDKLLAEIVQSQNWCEAAELNSTRL